MFIIDNRFLNYNINSLISHLLLIVLMFPKTTPYKRINGNRTTLSNTDETQWLRACFVPTLSFITHSCLFN